MRAAVLLGPNDLVLTDVPDPVPGPGDIVVSVGAVGICGSDLSSYHSGAYVRPGQIMGHEFAGTVVEIGSEVEGLRAGHRVAVRPLAQCGRCAACSAGLRHVCERGVRDAIGYGLPGAFAELVLVPRGTVGDKVIVLDDAIDDASGACVEPYAVALHAVRRLGVTPGQSCVVLGLGPIGLAAVQVLIALGIDRVVGVDSSPLRRERAAAAGAADAVTSDGMLDAIRAVAGPGPRGRGAGADAVLDASGSIDLVRASPALLRTGGRLGLVALYRDGLPLAANDMVTRELELVGCFGYAEEFRDATAMLRDGRLSSELLVTGAFRLDSIDAAFAAQADPNAHVKVQILP